VDQNLAKGVIADENGHEHRLTQTTKMRKAISLDVRLWIEGEDEPTHDFAQSTTEAVRELIEAGAAKYPGLSIKIRSIKEKS